MPLSSFHSGTKQKNVVVSSTSQDELHSKPAAGARLVAAGTPIGAGDHPDPVAVGGDVGVDAWQAARAAQLGAERDDADKRVVAVAARLARLGTRQWAAAVAVARVLAPLAAGAHLALAQRRDAPVPAAALLRVHDRFPQIFQNRHRPRCTWDANILFYYLYLFDNYKVEVLIATRQQYSQPMHF